MVQASRLGICIDEAAGRGFAQVLRQWRAPGAPDIHDVWELKLDGTTDEVLLSELGKRNFAAVVTRDTSMLSASVRRSVWRASRISVFMCDGRWGNLRLFEIARGLLWYWPMIVQRVAQGPQGGAWRLSADFHTNGIRQVLVDQE